MIFRLLFALCVATLVSTNSLFAAGPVRLSTFQVDVTPPLGSPLCNGNVTPVMEITTPLTARGIVLQYDEEPVVLCAFDWVGIANESYDEFRRAIAEAVGTTPERVAVHTLHQHDAPGSDFATERLLREVGLPGKYSNPDFDFETMEAVARAAGESLKNAVPVTHIGLGKGRVEKVASNRRILGENGKVVLQRQSSSGRLEAAREAPEGTIDPDVRLVAFWNEDQPVAVLTYYATHPQSYYGKGSVNWDFVGIAREMREETLGIPCIHLDGAGGNVAAGKYNDGAKDKRPLLASRLAEGMRSAWETQEKTELKSDMIDWRVVGVNLPVRERLHEDELEAKLNDETNTTRVRMRAARDLTFVRRMNAGHEIPVSCLELGDAALLHLPGELFVEYQLAAQEMVPDRFVAVAAYGDYGPGYIGTEIAYSQGGYETGQVSRVSPAVEGVLMSAIRKLLAPAE
ncbi:MAG: hypothetical protein CMJ46_13945 [Planctomyces sp.]|nr:hypothetical protein [Planctomyces sp.]